MNPNTVVSMEWSSKKISEWREFQKKHKTLTSGNGDSNHDGNLKWAAPTEGASKLNVDASVFSGASSFSIGMVLRNEREEFVKGMNMCVEGAVSVFEAESFGVCEALLWIMKEIDQPVYVESDSLQTINALIKNVHNQLEVGDILDRCRTLLDIRSNISLNFVKKQANKGAHLMARVPCLLNSYNVFLSPPSVLLETLMYDSNLF